MLGILKSFLLLLQLAYSIYEEQYGEFNWHVQNIGFIDDVVYNVRNILNSNLRFSGFDILIINFSSEKLMLELAMAFLLV